LPLSAQLKLTPSPLQPTLTRGRGPKVLKLSSNGSDVSPKVLKLSFEGSECKPLPRGEGGRGEGGAVEQGLTLVHVKAQLEQLQDTFMS